jgi:SAM-dependent methyltransferase/uncharacterized protein YbaR (Trm112 family)
MWKRFHKRLCCPSCGSSLELAVFNALVCSLQEQHLSFAKEANLLDDDFNKYVKDGCLPCRTCNVYYPILNGLPVMLSYATSVHEQFANQFKDQLKSAGLRGYHLPCGEPVVGEHFVLKSFSKEWGDYDYDGVLWDASYQDLEERVCQEINLPGNEKGNRTFLEVGCGLGVTTYLAQKNYGADAVGVDLSHSVFQASTHFRLNPFLHFVQASVFSLPFEKRSFDAVYSRGALHHTFSTFEAVKSLTEYCRGGGLFYLWVYGTNSIEDNWFRKMLYTVETAVRPFVSEHPESLVSNAFLNSIALGYLVYNKFRRLKDQQVQRYTFGKAVHAARDRFTPKFAHRHETQEVAGWFKKFGYERIEVVDWQLMPSVEQDDFRRNVGIRGIRKSPAA